MSSEFGGIIDSNKTYTTRSLAEVLGRTEDWVLRELIARGLRNWPIGRLKFISGKSFQILVESQSEQRLSPSNREKREAASE